MPSVTGRFQRTDRILRSSCFRRVTGMGVRSSSRNFVVFVDVEGVDAVTRRSRRIGITVSKRVGNAVVRNYVKRRIREWYRHIRQQLPAGAEMIVIARPPSCHLTTAVLFNDLNEVVQRFRVDTGKIN